MYNRREKNLYYIVILFERSVFYSIPPINSGIRNKNLKNAYNG